MAQAQRNHPRFTVKKKVSTSKAAAKRPHGRPAVITLAVVEQVGELMALGVPEEYACALAGVKAETFGPAVSRKAAFKAAMVKHHARFMEESLRRIRDGGEIVQRADGVGKDGEPVYREERVPWTGRAWILERRYKPHFNRTDQHALTKADGSGCLLTSLDMGELERMAQALHTTDVPL